MLLAMLSYLCRHDSMYATIKHFTVACWVIYIDTIQYMPLLNSLHVACWVICIDMIQYTSPLSSLHVLCCVISSDVVQYIPPFNSLHVAYFIISPLTWYNTNHCKQVYMLPVVSYLYRHDSIHVSVKLLYHISFNII